MIWAAIRPKAGLDEALANIRTGGGWARTVNFFFFLIFNEQEAVNFLGAYTIKLCMAHTRSSSGGPRFHVAEAQCRLHDTLP